MTKTTICHLIYDAKPKKVKDNVEIGALSLGPNSSYCYIMEKEAIHNITEQFTTLYPKLFRYAMSLTGDKHTSDDLVMNVFITVLEKFRESDEFPTQLEFYLIRSIRNKFIDDKRRFDRVSSFDDTEGYLEPVDPDLPSDPFMRKRIARSFQKLSSSCREFLGLIAQGWSYAEIQKLTKRNKNSVAGAVFKCRKNFKIQLYGTTDRRF